ncbi:MAG: hypothetical protein OCD76_23635 [Reichenbachiella sp.]
MESSDKNELKDLKNFFKNRSKEIKEEKDQIISMIGSHLEKIDNSTLSESDKQKNKKELTHLGNFLRLLDDDLIIEEAVRESPNFMIRRNKSLIGIELRDMYSNIDAKETEGSIDQMFREIETELKDLLPTVNGVYKIEFKENISFDTQESEIKDEIIQCIKSSAPSLKYVEKIKKDPGNSIHLYTNEASSAGPLNKEVVLDAIAHEEKYLNLFKSSSNASEFWVILVLSDSSASSNYSSIDHAIIEYQFNTGFEKVFIFDFFEHKIIQLKTI